MFEKILIANRGEIAIRIMKAASEMEIQTVAIFSEADGDALHIRYADEAYQIGEGNELKDTYLNISKIIEIAKLSDADAIHPGYGFLAENPEFVAACERENITFIGPHTRAIQLMGNKIESRNFVKEIGIPMTEAVSGDMKELMKAAEGAAVPGKYRPLLRRRSTLEGEYSYQLRCSRYHLPPGKPPLISAFQKSESTTASEFSARRKSPREERLSRTSVMLRPV